MAAERPASGGTAYLPEQIEGGRRGPAMDVVVRLLREKPLGLIGAIIVLVICIAAVGAPILSLADPSGIQVGPRLESPTMSHPFGTDNLGRDVYSRVVYGARVSMTVGLLAVIIATIVSLVIAVPSGYFGGKTDLFFQRLVDAFIAFPALLFIIAVTAIFTDYNLPFAPTQGLFQTDVIMLFIVLGFILGVGQSRVIRGSALSVREMPYVEAARAAGAGHTRIIMRHILPNVMAPTITLATLGLGNAILIEAALSFLGLGVPPDVPSWGGMLNREARSFMQQGPWIALAPGIALSLAVFGFNMLGDALRDLLDPRLRT